MLQTPQFLLQVCHDSMCELAECQLCSSKCQEHASQISSESQHAQIAGKRILSKSWHTQNAGRRMLILPCNNSLWLQEVGVPKCLLLHSALVEPGVLPS